MNAGVRVRDARRRATARVHLPRNCRETTYSIVRTRLPRPAIVKAPAQYRSASRLVGWPVSNVAAVAVALTASTNARRPQRRTLGRRSSVGGPSGTDVDSALTTISRIRSVTTISRCEARRFERGSLPARVSPLSARRASQGAVWPPLPGGSSCREEGRVSCNRSTATPGHSLHRGAVRPRNQASC